MPGSSIVTTRAKETEEAASRVARELVLGGKARVVALKGELGSGKTTFVKGFARGLGISAGVASPTFVIMKPYEVPGGKFETFWHVDLWRLSSPEELCLLGFEDIVSDPKNAVAVEWADRAPSLIPRDAAWVSFEPGEGDERTITIS